MVSSFAVIKYHFYFLNVHIYRTTHEGYGGNLSITKFRRLKKKMVKSTKSTRTLSCDSIINIILLLLPH